MTGTRSYRAVLDKARDDSGPIQVRISDAVGRVDFGYAAPDPKVHVDKTTQAYDCNDERCTVGWDVVVDNAGTETLPAGSTVFDRMSADVTVVRASIGTQTQDDPFLTRFSQISTGPEYTLALDQDGHIWSWGRNDSYQLGDGTNVDRAVPARIDPDPEHPNLRFVQVQAADTRGMALDENGVLWGWGNNHHWQITPPPASLVNARGEVTVYADGYENGRYLYVKRPTKIVVSGPDGQPVVFRRFSSRFTVTVGIDDQGHAWSWGQNYDLAAGRGVGTWYCVIAGRMANVGDWKFVDVDTGFRHGMLLQDDGTVWNFGTNASGQLGVTGGNHQPTPVDGIRAKAIAAGVYGEYIVALDGTVYASGTNGDGQLGCGFLGDGDEGKQHVFQPVEGTQGVTRVGGRSQRGGVGRRRPDVRLGRERVTPAGPHRFSGHRSRAVRRTIPGTPVEASIGALQWMGWEHIMMLQDDGTIVGWGNNSHTVLGGGPNHRIRHSL